MTWDMRELKQLLSDYVQERDIEPCRQYPRTIEYMAKWLAEPEVADWLIERSKKTPYIHLPEYMERDWLFNPYLTYEDKQALKEQGLPLPPSSERPSGRVHHILRQDHDRHHHDHPWNAQTIILRGWYREIRLLPDGSEQEFLRVAGDTATLDFGEYHRITEVSDGGVWTLFITHQYQGTWGFLVDGKKVPYRQYLGL
jgi:hypothetical protein